MGVGCGLDVVRRSECLVVGPVAVCGCGFLFGCAVVGLASGSMAALIGGLVPGACLWLGPLWLGFGFSLALADCGSWALCFVVVCWFDLMIHCVG